MKKILLIAMLSVIALLLVAEESLGSTPKEQPFRVVSKSATSMSVKFRLPEFQLETETHNGTQYQRIILPGSSPHAETGMPELPLITTSIAIPARGGVQVSVTNSITNELNNFIPIPAQAGDDTSSPKAMVINQGFYSGNGSFPSAAVEYSDPVILRDFRIFHLQVNPFEWNSATGALIVRKELDLVIDFTSEPGINELAEDLTSISNSFVKTYEMMILNFDDYRYLIYPKQPPNFLIIYGASTDQAYMDKVNEFAFWKRQKGATVRMASTSVAGTSTAAIKTYIQGQYDNLQTRPDFIIFIGDTAGSYSIPTFVVNSGPGDYPYTHLAGGDGVGDCFIGRISVENYTQFETLLAKIYAYEKNINIAQADWLNRMLLVGDWSPSGISTMYINKYLKEVALNANPDYAGGFTELYSDDPSATAMNAAINQGLSFFNYRGYLGMSGWSPSESLINGNKLPHSIIITCGTGNFNGSTATSEAFVRLGTPASPKGAVTSVGMATSSTHTSFNNSVTGGMVYGIFQAGMRTMGESLLAGKLNTHQIYGISSPNNTISFNQWSNLMGDPTMEVFVGIPDEFTMNVQTVIPLGLSLLDVNISSADLPVENASVTLSQGTQVISRGYTDVDGNVILVLPDDMLDGNAVITVAKHDFKPLQQTIMVENSGTLVPGPIVVDDDNSGSSSGNSNAIVNAGEAVELLFGLRNTGADTINGITGTVTCTSPYVTFVQNTYSIASVGAGLIGYNITPVVMEIAPETPNGTTLRVHLILTDALGTNYDVSEFIPIESPKLKFVSYQVVDGQNQALDPNETATFNVTITNIGAMDATDLQGRLYSLNDLVSVQDNMGYFGNVAIGGQANSVTDGYTLFARAQILPGMIIPLQLKLFNDLGFEQYVDFSLTIGVVTSHDPLGPCAYGYVIYDDTDTSYPLVPVYDWIEIAPSLGGQGSALAISDVYNSSNEGDQVGATSTAVVNLPFPFQFYGRVYEQITVCSNGFIGLGAGANGEFRNYRLPGAMGPSPMIAAFWDDLATHSGSGIYTWFDRNNHAFVVQWQNLKNGYNGSSEETFQVIMYDQSVYPTSLGDGPIKIQYKVFNNVNAQSGNRHGNYSTIGIEDHTGTRGLEYTYNNQYPTAAAQLGHLRALYITNIPVYHEAAHLIIGDTYIQDGNGNHVCEPGETIQLGIQLSNIGNVVADGIESTLSTESEFVTMVNGSSEYFPVEAETTGVNRDPFIFTISQATPNGTIIPFNLHIVAGEYVWDRTFSIRVDASMLSYHSFMVNDHDTDFNGIIEANESVKIIINLSNNADVESKDVVATLNSDDPFVLIPDPVVTLSGILPNSTRQIVYNVTFNEGIPTSTKVQLNFSATCSNGLPVAQDIFVPFSMPNINQDFEQDNGNLVSETGWAWGIPNQVTAYSGQKVWATGLSGQYPGFVLYHLYSPVYSIVQPSQLTFMHRYGTEANNDGCNVGVSTDGGMNFTVIAPTGGYPTPSILGLSGEPGYSGNSGTWVNAIFDLSAYQGQDVVLRFRFGSDEAIGGIGWFIDNLEVTGVSQKVGFLQGNVIPTSGVDPSLAIVSANNGLATNPLANGTYRLYLRNGHYSVQAALIHHTTSTNNQIDITQQNPVRNADFTLIDLPKPVIVSVTGDNDTGELNIIWTEPYDPVLPIISYKVYRKFNAGIYEMVHETTGTTYTEILTLVGNYKYYIVARYINADGSPSDVLEIPFPFVTGTDPDNIPGLVTKLKGNYPNPFNPTTTIAFDLAKSSAVNLRIYNLKGQLVKTLVNRDLAAGQHSVVWNGKDENNRAVSSGVYFYRMETRNYKSTNKMLLMK